MANNTTIKIRRDTDVNWSNVNPLLALGEIAFNTTNKRIKIGNGVDTWNALPYRGLSEAPNDDKTYVRKNGDWITIT